jgi:hypothetical protein
MNDQDKVLAIKAIKKDCCTVGYDGSDLLFLNEYGGYVRCLGREFSEHPTFARLRDEAVYVQRDRSGNYRAVCD